MKDTFEMTHLNSAQMERALAGEPDAALVKHMEHCAQCREEIEAMRQIVGNFAQSAKTVAARQRQMAHVPVRQSLPRWAWAGAMAALVVATVTPIALHRQAEVKTPAIAHVTSPQPAPQMSDEALLEGIQQDLNETVAAPLAPLESNSVNEQNAVKGRKSE